LNKAKGAIFMEDIIRQLQVANDAKIVLVVMDGLGGMPRPEDGKTELEIANSPNLDSLARQSVLGLLDPIAPGITPGSGPAHLSLFGYDPIKYQVGRGVLEALGIEMTLTADDLACRANFATRDENGNITDRRAGRIPTEKNQELVKKLASAITKIEDIKVTIKPGKEHRFVVVFTGEGLADGLSESDPQQTGVPPLAIRPLQPAAEKAARIANAFIDRLTEVLKEEKPANTCLLRGLAKCPKLTSMETAFGVKAAAIASYPMYRGLSKLVGMEVLATGTTVADEVETLKEHYDDYNFFYLHVKKTDSAGEDGNLEAKVKAIEGFDELLPKILELKPEVLAITADHSTPVLMKGHSFHPVPLLINSRLTRRDRAGAFSEKECALGVLGRSRSVELMPQLLGYAGKLGKFGA